MSQPGVRHSRRGLLRSVFTAAVAAPLLSSCDLLDGDPPVPPPPDPLTALHAETVALINSYDAAIATAPAAILITIRDAHLAHLAALTAIMTPAPSGTPQPPASAPPGGTLREAEQRARQSAIDACLTAAPARATLLGEIAAARACHLEVLP